jgi:hypothetical protein
MKRLFILVVILIFSLNLHASQFPKIEGWTPASEVRTYGPENLWEYINGAAELFLSYDFQGLRSCDLSQGDLVVTVDIYDMGLRLNGFGVYKTEKPRDGKTLSIGAEGIVSPPFQCLLLKDAYYVKVNTYEGEIDEANGKALLEAIAKSLPGVDDYPEELNKLPQEGKIPGSDGYARRGYLGLSELGRCVYAHYKGKKEGEFQYFYIVPAPEQSQKSIWGVLADKWKTGKNKQYPILYKEIPYKGLVGVMMTDTGIFGVTDSKNQSEMMKRLQVIIE